MKYRELPLPTTASSTVAQGEAQQTSASVSSGRVEWLERSEDAAWDVFVSAHPLGTLCQTTQWRDTIESSFPHIRGRVLVIRDHSGGIRSGTMTYTVRSWLLGNRLVSVPFGSRVDPLITESGELKAMIEFLDNFRAESAAHTLQIRLSKVPPPDDAGNISINRCLKRHYIPLSPGNGDLWAALDAQVRRRIRKAEREGVTIRRGRAKEDWDTLFNIHGCTRQRIHVPMLPRRFFAALAHHLDPEQWELFIAERNGEALGVDLVLIFNGVQQGEWAGDTPEGRRRSANQKMHWALIEDAAARGCHTFCFGRTDNNNTGLLEYKRRWGCIEEDMAIVATGAGAGSVQSRADTGITRRAAQGVIQLSPWPVFRRFSELCYRHLG